MSDDTMTEKKFRGVTRYDGRTVYGDLQHESRLTMIIHDGYREVVRTESVAQLVGVDKNGVEIYEGDTVELADERYPDIHHRYVARLTCCAVADDGCYIAKFNNVIAVEAGHADTE